MPCARLHACNNLGLSVSYYVPHTYVSHISSAPKIRTPYTQNNISYFGGMYRKNKGVPGLELATYPHAHQKQACTLLYTCVACLLVLLVRQKQRFHHPTLRTTSVTLVVCIERIKGCRRDLYLAKGAKVMLTKNLYQQVGLVNGIRGEVVQLVYADDAPPPKLPLYVVVKFRGYSGGEWSSQERYRGCVPISPVDTTCLLYTSPSPRD